jgi:hypothetical protein
MKQKVTVLSHTTIQPPRISVGSGVFGLVDHAHGLVVYEQHPQIGQALARHLFPATTRIHCADSIHPPTTEVNTFLEKNQNVATKKPHSLAAMRFVVDVV